MGSLFTLRDARESDIPMINAYTYAEGMDNIPSLDNVRVAANADDVAVGFIRIQHCADGRAYINPMATYSAWRGYGVGRALIQDAIEREGALWFVSRGGSIGFYERMGCVACDWEEIHPDIASDCDGCPMRDECGPLPMHSFLPESQK